MSHVRVTLCCTVDVIGLKRAFLLLFHEIKSMKIRNNLKPFIQGKKILNEPCPSKFHCEPVSKIHLQVKNHRKILGQ